MVAVWVFTLGCLCLGQFTYADDDAVTFIALGDWGDLRVIGQQQRVANAMSNWSAIHDPDFVLTLGDNFYPTGVYSVDDRQFTNKWYNIYDSDELKDLPWYISVGNHDHGQGDPQGQEWVQVEFSDVEPRWMMPYLWYSFYKEAGDSLVHFIVTDTENINKQKNNYTLMMEWIEDELANSEADYVIVVGHRHLYSASDVGPLTGSVYQYIKPLLEEYEADMYLCGHDHNLQHLSHIDESEYEIDYVISGGGGALVIGSDLDEETVQVLYDEYEIKVDNFSYVWGFVGFIITDDNMYWEFINGDGELTYSHARQRRQRSTR